MRNVVLMGAVILFAGSVGIAAAQERLPQNSGFGTGVGESAGTGTRSQTWDTQAFKERLSLNACVSQDRKSTRLNSSHDQISYAVFCLKKKKNNKYTTPQRRHATD